jgi:hypothetical protein
MCFCTSARSILVSPLFLPEGDKRRLAVSVVQPQDLNVAVSLPHKVREVPVRDFGKEWSWVAGQRVKGQTVDAESKPLNKQSDAFCGIMFQGQTIHR